jgi:acetyl esterase/lipase
MSGLAAWVYLLLGAQGLVWASAGCVRRGPGSAVSFWHFAAGLVGSEFAPHLLVGAVLLSGGFVSAGVLAHAVGWVGLALTGASVVCLLVSIRRSFADAGRLRRWQPGPAGSAAYSGATGPTGRRSVLRQRGSPREWLRPLHFRRAGVRRIRNVAYGPARFAHRLDLFLPVAPPAVPLPVLVNVHGGAWVLGRKGTQALPLMWHLATRGWICVDVEYRLSPRVRMPAHLEDVKRALAWVREHVAEHGGDPSFVALTGGSAGGHLAALAALTAREPGLQPGFEEADTSVQAAVPFYGKYDLIGADGDRADQAFRRFLGRWAMPAQASEDAALWRSQSPLRRVRADAPPFLVLHGTHDSLIDVREARTFVQRLREVSSQPVDYLELRGAQHAFDLVHSIRCEAAIDAVHRFLEREYVRSRAGAAGGSGAHAPRSD